MPSLRRTRCSLLSTFSQTCPKLSVGASGPNSASKVVAPPCDAVAGAARLLCGSGARALPSAALRRGRCRVAAGRCQATCAHALHEALALFGRHACHALLEAAATSATLTAACTCASGRFRPRCAFGGGGSPATHPLRRISSAGVSLAGCGCAVAACGGVVRCCATGR